MTSSPLVRKLGFTGSTGVGKLSMRHCADQVKKVSLELGGNAPFIVFDDADLDIAVSAALVCSFRNSGQTCVSANRMRVRAGIYDAFVERLTADVAPLRVADCLFEGVQVGPLIDEPAIGKVEPRRRRARPRRRAREGRRPDRGAVLPPVGAHGVGPRCG